MQEIEDFIENLPRDEKVILERLRALIFGAEPRLTEKFSYGVPYYSRKRRLFFIWPASAGPVGSENKRTPKVTLGFCYGNLLSNDQGLLVKDGRKQVFTIPFSHPDEIADGVISEILNEAILVDQQFFGRK